MTGWSKRRGTERSHGEFLGKRNNVDLAAAYRTLTEEIAHAAPLHRFRDEQIIVRRLQLSFGRGENRYAGNVWTTRHNRYKVEPCRRLASQCDELAADNLAPSNSHQSEFGCT